MRSILYVHAISNVPIAVDVYVKILKNKIENFDIGSLYILHGVSTPNFRNESN